MARRSRRRSSPRRWSGLLILFLLIAGIGVGGAWWLGIGPVFRRGAALPHFTSAADAASSTADLARMSRADLEAEVRRLQRQLDDRDKQISDLMIQIKLTEAGSSAKSTDR